MCASATVRVQLERFQCVVARARVRFLRCAVAEDALHRVDRGEARVRLGVRRVGLDRARVVLDRARVGAARALVPEVAPLLVQGVGLAARRRPTCQPHALRRRELRLQCAGDPQREVALDREDVGAFPLVRLRPQVESVAGIDQLGSHAHALARAAHAALQDGTDAERLGDLADVARLPLERER